MRFLQLDQITHLEPGKSISGLKRLTGDEDYLADHFPRFAVMPGVLMLEALYQASNLLVRASENHERGLVILRAVKNVKFGDFMQPGDVLSVESEILKQDGSQYTLKATGKKGDANAVGGRIVLDCIPTEPETSTKLTGLYMKQLTEQLQQASMA